MGNYVSVFPHDIIEYTLILMDTNELEWYRCTPMSWYWFSFILKPPKFFLNKPNFRVIEVVTCGILLIFQCETYWNFSGSYSFASCIGLLSEGVWRNCLNSKEACLRIVVFYCADVRCVGFYIFVSYIVLWRWAPQLYIYALLCFLRQSVLTWKSRNKIGFSIRLPLGCTKEVNVILSYFASVCVTTRSLAAVTRYFNYKNELIGLFLLNFNYIIWLDHSVYFSWMFYLFTCRPTKLRYCS
jgi:hypothetical protein